MGWRDIGNEKRVELLQRKEGGEDLSVLAQEIGAKAQTLDRALRRLAQEQRGETEPKEEAVTVVEDGNYREIDSRSTRITTLEQLLAYCRVDLGEWVVDRHVINKWEVGRKATVKEIHWTEGVADGYVQDKGEVNVKPLFQIKVWLVRKQPVEITPVIKPVHVNVKFNRPYQAVRGMRAALVVPDPQFGFSRDVRQGDLLPFHDRAALDLVRQLAELLMPEVTVFLGDINDFSGWSDKYINRPEFYFTTQPALIEAAWYIGLLRERTQDKVYALEGNHEVRPETQVIKHLASAYQLRPADQLDASPVLGVDNLLGLSRMGVEYIGGYPDGEVWLNDTTRLIHGNRVRGIPGQTASAVAQQADETTIFGHIHRREMATRTIRFRGGYRTITAYSPGCLCHVDGRVPGSSKTDQWQQGAAVIWYDDERSTIVPIDIQDGAAVYNGVLYQGEDYTQQLRNDTDWNF
jgi:transposase-like protein